jgi:ParB-like chromosome segregation protein Spo0J
VQLRTLPLDELAPAPYNPRRALKPGDPAWVRLERSLREFGLVEPLVWNEATGHVVGGHARLAILRTLGVREAPVSVVRLTPERERALNVLLNNREAQGRFDPDKLADLLTELEALPEFELTGFTPADLRGLRLAPLPPLDAEPEPKPEAVEVRLRVNRADYDRLAPALDALIREFELECRVRGL